MQGIFPVLFVSTEQHSVLHKLITFKYTSIPVLLQLPPWGNLPKSSKTAAYI